MPTRFAASIVSLALASSALAGPEKDAGHRAERINIAGSESDRPPGKGDFEVAHILLSRPVQRDLRLTDAQAERLDPLFRSLGGRSRELLMEYRNAPDPEAKVEVWGRLSELNDDNSERYKAELDPLQSKRLDEISTRLAGLRALLLPRVADSLRLTADQRKELKQVLPPLYPMDKGHERADEKAELVRSNVELILTHEQRDKLLQLGGEPLDPGERRPQD
jgi:hypothetical protein